jgi:oligopeptide transport system ATP-binding protein
MYAGRIVETAATAQVFKNPQHPYTHALQRSIPALQGKNSQLYTIPGLPPDMSRPPQGCAFSPRCAYTAPSCRAAVPALELTTRDQLSACLRVQRKEITLG